MKKLFAISIILFCLFPILSLADVGSSGQDISKKCDIFDSRSTCYQQLAPITDPSSGKEIDTTSFSTYMQAIYRIGIGACFALGVIMFVWAGIEYIITESIYGKSDAKNRITSALTGLAIALVSYLMLQTINPDLLNIQNLDTAVNTTSSATK